MTLKRLLTASMMLLLALTVSVSAFAQDKVISGKVTDSKDGSPVVGASVVAKGSNSGGSVTGADGSFKISVAANTTTLVVSYVGYGTQEISIAGKTSVDVSLSSSGSNLNEVVVVGYGTARRKDLTGSVASVKAKDFNQGIVTAPDQLIQGKVAGVQVINNSGAPGGATTIRIRGISSIRSGNQPLFVVDGVPLSGGSPAPGLGTALGGAPGDNPLNFLNPNDIASMEVLKDASATAIYGSRGANGVVIITTKKGQSGAPKIEFNTSASVSSIMKKLEVLDGNGFRAALSKYGLTSGNFGGNVDAMDAITQSGISQNHNIAISSGNDAGRYRISVGYQNQQGIIKESGFKKYSASFTGSYRLLDNKKLGLDYSIITSNTVTSGAPISNDAGFQGSLIANALQWNPTAKLDWTPANPIGTGLGATTINPMALLAAYDDQNSVTQVLANISPSYKITNDLEYKFLYGINYGVGERRTEIRRWLNIQGNRGFGQIANNRSINQSLTHTLNYTKDITSNLSLNALVGYEYLRFDYKGSGMQGNNFVDYPGIKYTDYMQNVPSADRSMYSFADPVTELQSYFGRVNLGYKDKYLLTATVRRDGSNKFGKNNTYGTFPSVAGKWIVSNESFLKNNKLFSNLAVRASWGQTGNQEFPANAPLRVVNIGQGDNQSVASLENPDIKWETNTLANIGVDFSVLDGRLSGSVDYYNRKTTDPIFQQIVTQPGPPFRYWTNLQGTIVNSGVEVALSLAAIKSKDLNWNVNVNAAFQKNELKDFVGAVQTGSLSGQGISGATAQRLVSGQPLNVYYLRSFLGIDKTTGQSNYKLNPDGSENLSYVGSPNPKMIVGFSTDLTYKKWFAAINLNGAFGHYLYNNTANSVLPIGNIIAGRNITKSLVGGSVTESTSNPIAPSTRYLEKGDYIKLANMTIAYRLGNIAKVIKNANVALTGQNLFVITKWSGFDPEVNTDKNVNGVPSLGIEYTPYPTARNIQLSFSFSL
ncbi:MAG: SusC/RagA family TonB-linked outer membrane protein [Chitinophagaceae bacterium]|uniref:SusC/RagA family TonB-linked outer membrane protein n=1 Tax=unclassified Paraflavitalea TaxID=2798305 RepID=UPI003D33AC1E|nr:SusC/RagA family TonB-linked outer membrane protein [Chitinophagaceae bacterium]